MTILNQSSAYKGATKVNMTTGKVKANAKQISDVNLVTPNNQQQFKKIRHTEPFTQHKRVGDQ